MNFVTPKVFISYSWVSSDRVLELATRLMGDGVEVILDKWNLKEGQDKHKFMETAVTDSTIGRVLLICDKSYAEKANSRTGGVGDETMVISPEVYAKATETKYIPIIFERDESGIAYTPAYLKSRIHIDLADDDQYEKNYESLLRAIYDKQENRKPALGKRPEWLEDERVDFSGVRNLIRQIKQYDGKNENKLRYIARQFNEQFVEVLLALTPENNADFDAELLAKIDESKPLKDLYLDYVETLVVSDLDIGTIIGDFFESVYNDTYKLPPGEGRSCGEREFTFSRFFIWEMFIGTIVMLLHNELYVSIYSLLNRTYFIAKNAFHQGFGPRTFSVFQYAENYIDEHINPKNENTLAGDIVIKREKKPSITQYSMANADVVLYQLSQVYEFEGDIEHDRWFPLLYCYQEDYAQQLVWTRMMSKRHCQKLFPLFGVESIEQLKTAVERNKPNLRMRHPNSYHPAREIQEVMTIGKIGALP